MTAERPERLLEMLLRHGVPFVVVGGLAVVHYGYVRATEDADVVWRRTAASEQQLLTALTEVSARWLADAVDPATGLEREVPVTIHYIQGQHLMMLCTDLGFLDLFDYIPGHPGQDVEPLFADAVDVDGIRYCSTAWLARMKLQSPRPKDRDDLANLNLLPDQT